MATAADYTARMPKYRAKLEAKALPDTYTITRNIETTDGHGGFTDTPSTVESGSCRLRAYLYGSEQPVADRLGWSSAGAVDLPYDTILVPSDQLVVNVRTFEIGVVARDGDWGMTATAIVRERN